MVTVGMNAKLVDYLEQNSRNRWVSVSELARYIYPGNKITVVHKDHVKANIGNTRAMLDERGEILLANKEPGVRAIDEYKVATSNDLLALASELKRKENRAISAEDKLASALSVAKNQGLISEESISLLSERLKKEIEEEEGTVQLDNLVMKVEV